MEKKLMLVINSSYPVSEQEMTQLVQQAERRANNSESVNCYIAPLPTMKGMYANSPSNEVIPDDKPDVPTIQCPDCKGRKYDLNEPGKIPCISCNGKGVIPENSIMCRVCGTIISDSNAKNCSRCNEELTPNNICTYIRTDIIYKVVFYFNDGESYIKSFALENYRRTYINETILNTGVRFDKENIGEILYPYHSIVRMRIFNVKNAANTAE